MAAGSLYRRQQRGTITALAVNGMEPMSEQRVGDEGVMVLSRGKA
jgi:hypothetical protein